MSSNLETTPPTKPSPASSFEGLAVYHRQIPLLVIGLGLLLAAIPITSYGLNEWSFRAPAVIIWGAALSLFVLTCGIVAAVPRPGTVDLKAEADRWRKNPWALIRCGAALFGGLILMFIGLQLARTFERTQPNLRRLLYGYNAVLGSLLLISVLGLLNVLAYVHLKPFSYLNQTFDWTSSGLYTLSDQDRAFLANELREPAEVVVIMPANDPMTAEVETLLNNCRAVTPLINWRISSRDLNRSEFARLQEKYQIPGLGVLVLYGKEPNITSEFIKYEDLFERKFDREADSREGGNRFVFKGEAALINALQYLNEGKARATIYFTQGHEELKLDDGNPNQFDQGLGVLKEDLAKANYQVRPLLLDRDTKSVP